MFARIFWGVVNRDIRVGLPGYDRDTVQTAGKVKGLVLLNARTFCVERFGKQGWERVRDALSPHDRDVMDSAVHVGWYEVGVYDHVHDAMVAELGGGDFAVMIDSGHFSADRDLTTVHRLFARMATVEFLLTKYGEFWKRYQDTGRWQIEREGPHVVRAKLTGWASRSEATCIRLGGYIERFLQIVGAQGAKVTRLKCAVRGDRHCELLCEWESGLG